MAKLESELIEDIDDAAESLRRQNIHDPFSIQVIWENWCEEFEVLIDVSIKPKGTKNATNFGSH